MEAVEIKDKELHRVATTCIIYNAEGKYLVTKRSPHKKMQPNKWTVPGGGLNVDDYMHKPKYLLDLTFISPAGVPCLVISYYAPYVSGEVKLDEDAVEYKWATLAEAKELDLIKGIYEEIEMVDKLLKI